MQTPTAIPIRTPTLSLPLAIPDSPHSPSSTAATSYNVFNSPKPSYLLSRSHSADFYLSDSEIGDVDTRVKPLILPEGTWTLLPLIIKICIDPQELYNDTKLLPFSLSTDGAPIGYCKPIVVEALKKDNEKMASMKLDVCFEITDKRVAFSDWVNEGGIERRDEHMDRLVRGWRHAGVFSDQLNGTLFHLYASS